MGSSIEYFSPHTLFRGLDNWNDLILIQIFELQSCTGLDGTKTKQFNPYVLRFRGKVSDANQVPAKHL